MARLPLHRVSRAPPRRKDMARINERLGSCDSECAAIGRTLRLMGKSLVVLV